MFTYCSPMRVKRNAPRARVRVRASCACVQRVARERNGVAAASSGVEKKRKSGWGGSRFRPVSRPTYPRGGGGGCGPVSRPTRSGSGSAPLSRPSPVGGRQGTYSATTPGPSVQWVDPTRRGTTLPVGSAYGAEWSCRKLWSELVRSAVSSLREYSLSLRS